MSESDPKTGSLSELPAATRSDPRLRGGENARTVAYQEGVPVDLSRSEFPVVAGYEILGLLGRGGMGVVYHARQLALNRPVALKMTLGSACVTPEIVARLRSEARAVARLQHPNIVQIFEVSEHEGRPFFSLEFCAFGSLQQRINGVPLPLDEAARLVETLAWAVQAAHDRGVIHRDLKPANVLLAEEGAPKIADFGLAKHLNDDSAGQTRTGAILGSPSYMAPEQAKGDARSAGPAADVYALGAILYECLTGRPPFRQGEAEATSTAGSWKRRA